MPKSLPALPAPTLPEDSFEIERAVEALVLEAFGESSGSPSLRLRQAIDAELDAGDESNRHRLWVEPSDYPPGPLRDLATLYVLLEQITNHVVEGTREELEERLTLALQRRSAYRAAKRRLQRNAAAKRPRNKVTVDDVVAFRAEFIKANRTDRGWVKACALELECSEDTVSRRMAKHESGSTA